MEIRRSFDRLISTMGFSILVIWYLYIQSGPCSRNDGPWGPCYVITRSVYIGICAVSILWCPQPKMWCRDSGGDIAHNKDHSSCQAAMEHGGSRNIIFIFCIIYEITLRNPACGTIDVPLNPIKLLCIIFIRITKYNILQIILRLNKSWD